MSEDKRQIRVDVLTRVEGEGALEVDVENGKLTRLALRIYEPPRFFESFLVGRHASEVSDLVARICGICPVAYQMSAVHALERALDVDITPAIHDLRRALYCGEWLESHALHVFLLHLPDFLGYPSGLAMAKDHPDLVRVGLRIKKLGNALLEKLGGRAIHPISPCIGGFHGLPNEDDLKSLLPEFEWALTAAREAALQMAALTFPEFEVPYDYVSLKSDSDYPMNEGAIVSSQGQSLPNDGWDQGYEERQVAHSTALHAYRKDGGSYFTGPMARLFHNHTHLSPAACSLMAEVGYDPTKEFNPYRSLLTRMIEIVHALEEAKTLVAAYQKPAEPHAKVSLRGGAGAATTEAPRGVLFHRYELDEQGRVQKAVIVPPTSQNQGRIEEDLKLLIQANLDLDDTALRHLAEWAVRNYDPCISCSAHFLKLKVNRL